VAVASAGLVQVCTSLQTDNHASTSPLSFFTGRMPFLPPNQQRQSTKAQGITAENVEKSQHTDFNEDTANESASVACNNIRLRKLDIEKE